MESLFRQLKKYIDTASRPQLEEDWKKLKKFNEIGPYVCSLATDSCFITYNEIEVESDGTLIEDNCVYSEYDFFKAA